MLNNVAIHQNDRHRSNNVYRQKKKCLTIYMYVIFDYRNIIIAFSCVNWKRMCNCIDTKEGYQRFSIVTLDTCTFRLLFLAEYQRCHCTFIVNDVFFVSDCDCLISISDTHNIM